MCLLITQKANAPKLSDAWLKDFHASNADGVGVMYAQKNKLVIQKTIPKNAGDFIQFYREHIEGRGCAWHLRMRTHGDIDLLNCHPYEVLNKAQHGMDLWLMHNGVLSTGNKANPKFSDTWHYINNYLKPMLAGNPEFAFHPAFKALIGDHIGKTNKFVLMDNKGRQAVVNQDAGVYWGNLWLSNTYAWTAQDTKAKPVNQKLGRQQIAKLPAKKIVTYQAGVYPKSNFSNYYNNDYATYYNDDYQQIKTNLEDVRIVVGEHDLTYQQAWKFVKEFGIDAFLEVCDSVVSGNLTLEWFSKCLTDFKTMREIFPHTRQLLAF